MSATERDGQGLKTHPTDRHATSDPDEGSEERCCPTRRSQASPADEGRGIVAMLCRMALLRDRSLAVNGAYARQPPTVADGHRER